MNTCQIICQRVARNIQMPLANEYVKRQVLQYVQRAYEHIWNSKPWPQTLTDELTGTIALSTNYVRIPKLYQSILRAHDGNGGEIRIFGTQEFADFTNLSDDTSTGLRYLSPFGYDGVATQLTASQLVRLMSSTSQDQATAGIQVIVRGLDSTGESYSESVTITGTTAEPTAASFSRIDAVSKNRNSAGTISVKTDDEVTTLATIGPFEVSPRYPRYRANITPASAVTFGYIAKVRFVPFADINDSAIFDMDAALESKATELAHLEHRNMAEAKTWAAIAADDLDELVRREMNSDGSVELFAPMARG